MRIAFFGGTFDPPHCGHLRIAQAAADRLHLDKVLFAPVGQQPLKQDGPSASFDDRRAMVELAIASFPQFEVSLLDAPRQDHRPNYTIDTLLRLKKSLSADDGLFCLVGADSFLTLRHWYRAAEILFVCNFIVAGRPGSKLDAIGEALPAGTRVNGAPQVSPGLVQFDLNRSPQERSTLYLLADLHEDISATEIRAVLSSGGRAIQILPDAVAAYIREHGLYRK
jgi:nicotinate-nucleotide adenylyltransferase